MVDTVNKIIDGGTTEIIADPSIVKSNYTIKKTNLSKITANTNVFEGLTGLTIDTCYIRNCVFPPDTKLIGKNTGKDFHEDFYFPDEDESDDTEITGILTSLKSKFGVEKVNPILKKEFNLEIKEVL